jgi:hypothetical protein
MKKLLTIIISLISITGFTQNINIEGRYIREHSSDYIELKHDSSFILREPKGCICCDLDGGKWTLTKDTLRLEVVYDYLCLLDTSFIQINDKKIPIVNKTFKKTYSSDKKVDTAYVSAKQYQYNESCWDISVDCPNKLLVKNEKLIVISDTLKTKRDRIVFIKERKQ